MLVSHIYACGSKTSLTAYRTISLAWRITLSNLLSDYRHDKLNSVLPKKVQWMALNITFESLVISQDLMLSYVLKLTKAFVISLRWHQDLAFCAATHGNLLKMSERLQNCLKVVRFFINLVKYNWCKSLIDTFELGGEDRNMCVQLKYSPLPHTPTKGDISSSPCYP